MKIPRYTYGINTPPTLIGKGRGDSIVLSDTMISDLQEISNFLNQYGYSLRYIDNEKYLII